MDDLIGKAMPSRSNLEATIAACADIGKASGLEVAVKVLRALAEDGPKVDASEIRAAAASLEMSAEKLRKRSDKVLLKHKINTTV